MPSATGIRDGHLGPAWPADPSRRAVPPSRGLAGVAGVLLIVAGMASVAGGGLVDPVIGRAGHLARIAGSQDRIIAGTTLELVAASASAGVGIALYPVLRRHAVALALGSVAFRVIEGALCAVAAIGTLLLLTLAQRSPGGGAAVPASFAADGALLRALRDDAALVGSLAFYLGSGMYSYVLYRARVLPRWLTGWGLAGVAIGAWSGLCVLFRLTTLGSALHTALNFPIGLQEMVLAIWLLLNGFSAQARRPRAVRRRPPPWSSQRS